MKVEARKPGSGEHSHRGERLGVWTWAKSSGGDGEKFVI